MKNKLWIIGLLGLIYGCPLTSLAAKETPELFADEYIVGPGDILDISVWKDEALTKLVTVLPDGKISFPLIGQVAAGGKTVAQLREVLEGKLSRFVPDLSLSVIVHQVNSMMIYVIGRVNRPDRFILNTNVNVLQALSMAGGLNPFAKRSKIKISRSQDGMTQTLSFNYDEVTKGEKLEQNIMLKRGDVVVVP
ncbi:FIG123464: Polysaccharide export protein [Olavius sp. associated proteobacterium Delta 1]|nr:FIG123464: Polysaccharide export protein [Olavius sp. associated proteobacterium Delta 1]